MASAASAPLLFDSSRRFSLQHDRVSNEEERHDDEYTLKCLVPWFFDIVTLVRGASWPQYAAADFIRYYYWHITGEASACQMPILVRCASAMPLMLLLLECLILHVSSPCRAASRMRLFSSNMLDILFVCYYRSLPVSSLHAHRPESCAAKCYALLPQPFLVSRRASHAI